MGYWTLDDILYKIDAEGGVEGAHECGVFGGMWTGDGVVDQKLALIRSLLDEAYMLYGDLLSLGELRRQES